MLQPVEPRLHEYTCFDSHRFDFQPAAAESKCGNCRRLERRMSLFFQVIGNDKITMQERSIGIATVHVYNHERSRGKEDAEGFVRLDIYAIASVAGLSPKRCGHWIKHKFAGEYGLVERRSTTKDSRTSVSLRIPGAETVEDGYRLLAHFDPHKPENKTWGGRREKRISTICPHCQSDTGNTSLVCHDCGARTHADEYDDAGRLRQTEADSKLGKVIRIGVGGQV